MYTDDTPTGRELARARRTADGTAAAAHLRGTRVTDTGAEAEQCPDPDPHTDAGHLAAGHVRAGGGWWVRRPKPAMY